MTHFLFCHIFQIFHSNIYALRFLFLTRSAKFSHKFLASLLLQIFAFSTFALSSKAAAFCMRLLLEGELMERIFTIRVMGAIFCRH